MKNMPQLFMNLFQKPTKTRGRRLQGYDRRDCAEFWVQSEGKLKTHTQWNTPTQLKRYSWYFSIVVVLMWRTWGKCEVIKKELKRNWWKVTQYIYSNYVFKYHLCIKCFNVMLLYTSTLHLLESCTQWIIKQAFNIAG